MAMNERQREDACATITRLLNESRTGDPRTAGQLLPLVYEELRALAERRMRQESPGQTLGATALVHEAYIRLVDTTQIKQWQNKWHFFSAAAEAMRRILVDCARRKSRLKRGGGRHRVDLEKVDVTVDGMSDELIALDEALTKLAEEHPEKAKLVNLRYFAGLTHEEAAEALGLSISTADRHWAFARAWLYRHMES
jgi:RNA polymerase sigma factor (TIGR02999 family)